jgi:hypothetical protein
LALIASSTREAAASLAGCASASGKNGLVVRHERVAVLTIGGLSAAQRVGVMAAG